MHTTKHPKPGLNILLTLTTLFLAIYAGLDNITVLYDHIDMTFFSENQLGVIVIFGVGASVLISLMIHYSVFHLIYITSKIKIWQSSLYFDTLLSFIVPIGVAIFFQKTAVFQAHAHLIRTALLTLSFALCAFVRNRADNTLKLYQWLMFYGGLFGYWMLEFGVVTILTKAYLP